MDYPKELSPFAKDHRSDEGLVERFECFAAGMEFANAFTELNDPDEQRARFEQQRADEAAGDEETQPYDEDYVAALEYGMPPTGGIGIGIDRLTMIMSGRHSIREVVLFPAMRSSALDRPAAARSRRAELLVRAHQPLRRPALPPRRFARVALATPRGSRVTASRPALSASNSSFASVRRVQPRQVPAGARVRRRGRRSRPALPPYPRRAARAASPPRCSPP